MNFSKQMKKVNFQSRRWFNHKEISKINNKKFLVNLFQIAFSVLNYQQVHHE